MIYLSLDDISINVDQAIAYSQIMQFDRTFEETALRILLVRRLAATRGLSPAPVDVQNLVIEWRYAVGLERGDAFKQYLFDNGISASHIHELMEHIERERLIKASMPEQEVSQYFAENRHTFDRAELLRLVSGEVELLQEIKELVAEEGEPFQGFAATHSAHEASARQGGYIGWCHRSELGGEAEAAIFSAKPGAVLGPFKVDGEAYELYYLLSLEIAEKATVEAAVRETLFLALLNRTRLESTVHRFPPPVTAS